MVISEQIIEVLDHLCAKLGIVVNWTGDNVLPYIQTLASKFITYKIVTNSFWIIFGVIFLILGFACYKNAKKFWNQRKNWDTESGFLFCVNVVGTIFCFIVGVAICLSNIYDLCVCIAFPELQIFEAIKPYLNK
jgi:uncharacterized membrane protein